jgi:uncharacterized protein YbaR (Trm112 family)
VLFQLTDLLTCPRCGPTHGLILLAQQVKDRRVQRGWLGCPHCRTDYPVTDGVADLRLDPAADRQPGPPLEEEDLALKIVALSGLAEERGYLLLDERLAHVADAVAQLAPDLEVISVKPAPDGFREGRGVSRLLSEVRFPLVEYRLRAVAIAPARDQELVAAAARRVAAGGRLLLFDAGDVDLKEVEASGLVIVAAEGGTAVAEREIEPKVGLG